MLAALFRPQVSSALQQAAVAALGRSDDRKVAEMLLSGWKGHSPQLRSVILDALLSRPTWTSALLSSLEDTCTPPAEIDPAHRKRLLDHRDPKVKARAEAVFERETTTRQAVLDAYRPALARPGDPDGRSRGVPEGLRDLPPPGRRGERGRPRPGRAGRQVARVAPGRDPRPEPGGRGHATPASTSRWPTAAS